MRSKTFLMERHGAPTHYRQRLELLTFAGAQLEAKRWPVRLFCLLVVSKFNERHLLITGCSRPLTLWRNQIWTFEY